MSVYKTYHSYHIVDPSPWPFLTAYGTFLLTLGFTLWMHRIRFGFTVLFFGLFMLTLSVYSWLRDIIRESTFEDCYTEKIE